MYDSDCVVVMGSNMAENHPVAFRWPMKAKVEHGTKIIHIDPRFTRTSAVADIYAPVRAGSDIAFLGGVINYVINSERWNKDSFFQTFVVNYTNAATLLREDFKDTEDLDGAFSGLEPAKGGGARLQDLPTAGVAEWPFNGLSTNTTARVGSTRGRSRLRSVQSPWNSSRERDSPRWLRLSYGRRP
jgi:Anaerobic dehydrogenases, typically selenocysteine-containing